MRTRFLKVSLLCAFFAAGVFVTGCSDDNGYSDVDGQSPVAELKTTHLQSAAGHDFTIEGTLTDADGISAVRLTCAELFLDKTIDLIEIYGEPKTSYNLSYKFNISKNEIGEQFTVKVTVVDIGGRETSQDVLVTMDGDYENPVFVKAPGEKAIVLLADGVTPTYTLNVSVTDDQVLKYLEILIEGLPDYSPLRVMADGKGELNFSKKIELTNEVKDYKMTFTAVDNTDKSTVVKSVLSVSELQDFEKIYLADTDDLTNDVFGVPMVINHTGSFQYKARYYNKEEGTQIYFLPQKESFEPVCFGLNLEDKDKLTYASGKDGVNPIVLETPNVYYEIDINIKEATYSLKTYSVSEATDPINYEYGQLCDMPRDAGEPQFNFYIGWGDSPQNAGEHLFVQDANNPHLFYYPAAGETWSLESGEEMNFIISNYHPNGWWDQVEWRCDNSTDIEKFGYFSKADNVNPNWEGTNRKWADGSSVQDYWMKPTITKGGNYRFEFDAHLGRGKIVPAN